MIGVSKVTKHFDEVQALAEVNLDIATGEFISIVGPSGCGKSTLLRIIADLVSTDGTVKKPNKGAFVFQDSALLPWRTVQGNVELLMELEGTENKRSKAAVALKQVGLNGFERSYPHQLSGGMKMRLSLARSLVLDPEYILLDEPLSAVDELTREVLQEELYDMWKRDKFTAILVTHNIAEAVYLSNRVVIMSPRPGKITDIVDISKKLKFKKRTPEIRTTPQFSELVNEIAGKLRSWK
jgi:NitT/TauT family transport system ATP-binding protein|tara:strand:- start:1924 stop:2640 length:717 start_codon:yes stop_codon:yes gene_type:complete